MSSNVRRHGYAGSNPCPIGAPSRAWGGSRRRFRRARARDAVLSEFRYRVRVGCRSVSRLAGPLHEGMQHVHRPGRPQATRRQPLALAIADCSREALARPRSPESSVCFTDANHSGLDGWRLQADPARGPLHGREPLSGSHRGVGSTCHCQLSRCRLTKRWSGP